MPIARGGILEDAVWLKFPIDRSIVLYRDSSHELNMFAFCLFVYLHPFILRDRCRRSRAEHALSYLEWVHVGIRAAPATETLATIYSITYRAPLNTRRITVRL